MLQKIDRTVCNKNHTIYCIKMLVHDAMNPNQLVFYKQLSNYCWCGHSVLYNPFIMQIFYISFNGFSLRSINEALWLSEVIVVFCDAFQFILTYFSSLWLIVAHCGLLRLIVTQYCSLWLILAHCGSVCVIIAYCGALWLIVANCGLLWSIVAHCHLWQLIATCCG